jgi:hypothetical protein
MSVLLTVVAGLIALAAAVLFTRHEPRPETLFTPTLPGLTTVAFAVILNWQNLCNPGWCTTYGFPFQYFHESDDMITFNGERIGAGFKPAALVEDAAVAVAAVAAVQLWVRRHRRNASATTTQAPASMIKSVSLNVTVFAIGILFLVAGCSYLLEDVSWAGIGGVLHIHAVVFGAMNMALGTWCTRGAILNLRARPGRGV